MYFSTSDEIPAKVIHHRLEYDRQNIVGINNIIAFSSGRNKVGKTTIAVNVAVMLAQAGLKIGLLDAETNSDRPSEILGIEASYLPDSQDLSKPVENFGVKLVSIGSLIEEEPTEGCGNERSDYWLNQEITRILQQVQWGNLDYLILNLPPGMGELQISLAQAFPVDGVVMVATAQKDAHPDIYQTLRMFEQLKVPLLGLIENKCNIISAELSKRKYEIRGQEKPTSKIRVPFLGSIPVDPIVPEYSDRNLPVVLAEPSSIFTSALNAIVWAISSQITIAALKS